MTEMTQNQTVDPHDTDKMTDEEVQAAIDAANLSATEEDDSGTAE